MHPQSCGVQSLLVPFDHGYVYALCLLMHLVRICKRVESLRTDCAVIGSRTAVSLPYAALWGARFAQLEHVRLSSELVTGPLMAARTWPIVSTHWIRAATCLDRADKAKKRCTSHPPSPH